MSELIILKTHRNEKYSTINLNAIEDPRLSWKAKGIHTYLITRPPGWKIRVSDMLKKAQDGKFSLTKAVSELKKTGYLRINILKDEKGKFDSTVWEVFETPQSIEKSQSHPHPGFPPPGFPASGKPAYGKTDDVLYINSTNYQKTTTTTNNVVVVDFEKNNFSSKSANASATTNTDASADTNASLTSSKTHTSTNTDASADIDTLLEVAKRVGLEGLITRKAIRTALKAYNPASHANYQPETPEQGIKRILGWMKHIPTPDNPPGFLVRMARHGMDKPAVVVRAEQAEEAERLEREKRERERERLRAIEDERRAMTAEEKAEIKRLISSITKSI